MGRFRFCVGPFLALILLGAGALPVRADSLATMRELRKAATDAFDTNHPVEALKHLVAILALNEELASETTEARSSERAELVRRADAEITAIGARLTLEPTDEWLSEGKMIPGNVRDLSRGRGRMPAARLVANYDFGKSVVADAPIRFAFVDGLGDVVSLGVTDSYGTASAVVRSVASADKPAVVRAMLVVANRGKSRAFPEVRLDFTYVVPERTARIVAVERPAAEGDIRNLGGRNLADAVARGLSSSGLDLLPASAALDPGTSLAALQGDPVAVKRALVSGDRTVTYLILAEIEYDDPRQVVLQGKAYNIFTAEGRAHLRVLREDGSAAFTRPTISVKGQGGTALAALQSLLAEGRKAVEKDLAGVDLKAALGSP